MLKEMDVNPIVREAIVDLGDGSQHTTTVVPLAHASLPNNRWRRPVGYANGENGEIQLVQAAWAVSQTQAEMKNCVHTAVL